MQPNAKTALKKAPKKASAVNVTEKDALTQITKGVGGYWLKIKILAC
jgi:hypothetical protein